MPIDSKLNIHACFSPVPSPYLSLSSLSLYLSYLFFQMDVSHENRTHRVELLNDTPVCELFDHLEKELGPVILDQKSALLHWTNAEYDSPVEDVMKADMKMHLG